MKNKGFTLIELLISLIFIFVIGALVVFFVGFGVSFWKGKNGNNEVIIRTDKDTGAQYIMDMNGNYFPRLDKDGKQVFVQPENAQPQ